MLIRAKLKFNCEENGEKLIQSFFSKEAFNSKSRLIINENECDIEVFFEEIPPFDLMKEISYCDIISFTFDEENNITSKEINIISSLPEKADEAVENSAITEQTTRNREEETTETFEVLPSSRKTINGDIPEEVKKIIRENDDITVLGHQIAVFLKMKSYESFFENYLNEAFHLNKLEISWKNITDLLNKKGIKAPATTAQSILNSKVTKVMKKYNIPKMGLRTFTINVINYYNEFWKISCNTEKSTECEENVEHSLEFKELPENAEFNEKISKMPKNITEIEKVKYIFNALNSKIDDDWANEIAVLLLNSDFENLENLLNYEQRAKIATDINKIWNNAKVDDFLKIVKKIICS